VVALCLLFYCSIFDTFIQGVSSLVLIMHYVSRLVYMPCTKSTEKETQLTSCNIIEAFLESGGA
jgi:hypothetical protein